MVAQTTPWRSVSPGDVTTLKVKADGAGAVVYHGYLPAADPSHKPIPVALRKPRITSSLSLTRFDAELALRSRINHPNLLPLLAACTTAPHYCTISPWMAGGTLFDLIHKSSVQMSFSRLLSLSLQLARAIAYMHDLNLVHRDLKSSNILLDDTWNNLVLADLDLAADVDHLRSAASTKAGRALHRGPSNGRLSHMVGTLVYMAPEVLSGAPHSFAADVYAFAITVNEIAAAAVPFVDRHMPVPELHTVLETRFNEVRLRGAIVKTHLRPILSTGVPTQFNDLIQKCWQHNPADRPSMHQVVDALQSILDQGPQYLQQFSGSTIRSVDLQPVDSNCKTLLDDIRAAALNPPKPVWHTQQTPIIHNNSSHSNRKPLEISGGLSSTSGERGEDSMEDRSLVLHRLAGTPSTHLFAVFDGHGGQACSEFAAQNLPGAIFRTWHKEEATPDSALIHAFEDLDYAFLTSSPSQELSGCTALASLLIDSTLYVANAGDCRCVLGKVDGTVVNLSKDHVAFDPAEKARIEARGGFVSNTGRAMGCLMVSRAMGDRDVKRYITATPEVVKHEVSDEDDFIIMASDGLWDVVSSAEAVWMVRSTVRVPELSAKRLALKAIELGSDDNISVIVIFLRGNVSFSSSMSML